jgi:general nucleoside transport system permease protein
MTPDGPAPAAVGSPPVAGPSGRNLGGLADRLLSASGLRRLGLTLGAYVICIALFGLVVGTQGADPFSVYSSIIHSALFDTGSISQILVRAVPIVLAALAVSVPARAGLVNVGGEGQLIVGAIAATGMALYVIGAGVPAPIALSIMGLAGIAAGGAWGAIAGALRVGLNANEAVTTLLMNFIANDILLYLLYQPWKDPSGTGQPQSKALNPTDTLHNILGSTINLGVIIALVIAVGVYFLLARTGWGFALRVVGGNQEAARRAGLPSTRLMISSMAVGGGLAGLGGMLYLAGTQFQLLPGGTATFGYTAFLAAFLGRHDPIKVVLAGLLFSAIAISAPGLQLSYGLDGNVVDILLALAVAAPLALSASRRKAF